MPVSCSSSTGTQARPESPARASEPLCGICRSSRAGQQATCRERLSCRLPAGCGCCPHPARHRQLAMQEVMPRSVPATAGGVMDGQAEGARLG